MNKLSKQDKRKFAAFSFFDRFAAVFDRFGAVFDRLGAVIDQKTAPKRSIRIRLELPGPPKGLRLAVRVEFKC